MNNLQFVLKLTDMLTPGMRQAAVISENSAGKIKSQFTGIEYSGKKMNHSLDETRTTLKALEGIRSGTKIKAEFDDATRSINRLNGEIKKLENKGKSAGGGLGGMLGGYIGTAAISMAVGSSVKNAMDYGATKKSFEVLTGNADIGNALADNLNKLQQDTILGPEVFKAAQTMMGFGVATKDVEKNIKHLGDISMGNADKFNGLTLAFSNTAAAGRLMGQDLLQYINAGYNPLTTISKHWKEFGFTAQQSVGDLKSAMEKGLITADMVSKAIGIATGEGGKYYDMMGKMSHTAFGRMKMLEGQWEAFKIKTGEALIPLAEMLMKVAGFLIEHKELLFGAISAWGTFKIVSTASLAAQSLAATASLGPLGLIATAVGGIVIAWNMASDARAAYEKIGIDNSKKVYDMEKSSITAEVTKLMAKEHVKSDNEKAVQAIVDRVKSMHLENVSTGLRSSGMKLQEANRQVANVPTGFIPSEIKDKIKILQVNNKNYQDAYRAIKDFSAQDILQNKKAGIMDFSTFSRNTNTDLGKQKSESINQGGQRSIIININKQIEKIEQHIVGGGREAADEIEAAIQEAMKRVVYSLNGVAS